MSTLFTKIIAGEIPGRFVWSDERCVAFLSVNPLGPGHTLVVPREEVDQWVDASPELLAHLTAVSHSIAAVVRELWQPPRVAFQIAGFEVPHLHLHVLPAWDEAGLTFRNARTDLPAAALDEAAERVRSALAELGHGAHVPAALGSAAL